MYSCARHSSIVGLFSGLKTSILPSKSSADLLALGYRVAQFCFTLFGLDLIYFSADSSPMKLRSSVVGVPVTFMILST